MTISDAARAEVFGQEGGGFLVLLTINHASLGAPLRFVNNTVDITSNGNDYIAYPFDLTLPDERDGNAPTAKLVIDNVMREISTTIRQISDPPTISIQIVRIEDFDSSEVTLPVFTLRNVEVDDLQISGDLVIDDITKEPYPARTFTPAEYPGLFS